VLFFSRLPSAGWAAVGAVGVGLSPGGWATTRKVYAWAAGRVSVRKDTTEVIAALARVV